MFATKVCYNILFFFFSLDLQLVASEVKLHQLYQTTMSDARDHIRDLIVKAQEVLTR